MLGEFLPLTVTGFSKVSHFAEAKWDLNTPPALAGAGVRDGRSGQSPPTDVFCVVGDIVLVAALLGAPPPCPPGRLATLAAVRLPYIVGEVAALRCGRRGAEGLRFFGKIRKPPTPLRRLLRRRHLPCTAGEAWVLPQPQRRERKRSQPRSAMGQGLFDTGMTTRNKRQSNKRQHPAPTSAQSAFLWSHEGFSFGAKQKKSLRTRPQGLALHPARRRAAWRHNLHFCG